MTIRRSPAVAVALVVLVVAAAGAALVQHSPRVALSSWAATRDAVRDPQTAATLRTKPWTRVTVSPVDGRLARVAFYGGPRIIAEVAVRADGTVEQAVDYTRLRVPYGDWLAYQLAVMLGLAAAFVLVTAVTPLRRIRNLDVAAAVSLVAPVFLLQYRYLGASVLSAVPGLSYLMVRCAVVALAESRSPGPACTPLFEAVTTGWTTVQRARVLRVTLIALALVFAMVGVSSPSPIDVVYGVMEGATKLIHGVLPYGHMPGDVIHGDTYPILSYALYAPLALLTPVRSTWDAVDLSLVVAVGAALASALAVLLATARSPRAGHRRQSPETELGGLRAAVGMLAFPPLLLTVSTGTTDVVLAALLAFAVLTWHRPAWSTALLAGAGWFKLAPFALLPLWLAPLRGRRLAAALGAILWVSAAMLVLLVALGGIGSITAMVDAVAFQFSRGSPESVWSVLGLEPLQRLAQAGVLALIAGGAVRLARDPELAADRTRAAALAASVMIGLQLAADRWTFLYVVWVVPLLGLSLLGDSRVSSRAWTLSTPPVVQPMSVLS
jgi:hypothetical protein